MPRSKLWCTWSISFRERSQEYTMGKNSTCRRRRLEAHLAPCTNVDSEWTPDSQVRPETAKVLGDTDCGLLDAGLGDNFLDLTPRAKATNTKVDKWEHSTPQGCAAKGRAADDAGQRRPRPARRTRLTSRTHTQLTRLRSKTQPENALQMMGEGPKHTCF